MKFAVVEYSSKTGRIWRHTSERPNYLCNPDTEMDPTSFGCYVSALEGEHIPLTDLIVGEQAGISAPMNLWRKAIKRVTGQWPMYELAYLKQFDVIMVVHQISDGHEVTTFTKRLKKEYPHILILGVPTQPYGILKAYWEHHPDFLQNMQEFMNACDIFVTIVASTKNTWKALTTTRVEYLAQPYPVEYAGEAFLPLSAKKPIIFVAGVADRPDIPKGYEVARRLQAKFPQYTIQATENRFAGGELEGVALFPFKDFGIILSEKQLVGMVGLVPFKPWRQQLDYLASVKLVINTDYTQTRGRVQMDCAAIGTPALGSDSDAQLDLFPDLAATEQTSIDELVAKAERLLSDDAWYQSIIQQTQTKLPKYNYRQSAQRLEGLVERL